MVGHNCKQDICREHLARREYTAGSGCAASDAEGRVAVGRRTGPRCIHRGLIEGCRGLIEGCRGLNEGHRGRRGAVLVVVMVCLMVAISTILVVVRQVAMERRAMQAAQTSLQSQWLAEAGIERAAARLAADGGYAGETWSIPAAELAADSSATVKIHVETVADQPQRRSVRVEADFPDAPDRRCRQVKQIIVDRDARRSGQRTQTTRQAGQNTGGTL